MSNNKFIVQDNVNKTFSNEDVKIMYSRRDDHVSRVWAMSHQDALDLRTALNNYLPKES